MCALCFCVCVCVMLCREQFTCEKLGLNAETLPCAQKIRSTEASLKGTYNIVEEDEEELSLEDMQNEVGALPAASLCRRISAEF